MIGPLRLSENKMDSIVFPSASSNPGTLHYIPPNLCAFEPSKPLVGSTNINTLLWIGGIFDTLFSVEYPMVIAHSLGPTWSLVTACLGSAGKSWGVSSVAQDAEDIAAIVSYLKEKRPGGKVVIMGHSTGCQDCMEYTVGPKTAKYPSVDGVILQAGVSDREALAVELPETLLHEANQTALKMCREGKDKEAMPTRFVRPVFGSIAITARRWVDIASPGPDHIGLDDYFSSDLSDDRLKATFGKLKPSTPILIVQGGNDAAIPASVDTQALIDRWSEIVKSGGANVDEVHSGVVLGASHNLNGNPEAVVQDLVRRVVGFIDRLDKNDFPNCNSQESKI
ncbi:Hypothetical protein R9X50_00395300 [Acrodontium crateriforme]|uniref:DUF1749-domain-containing protein n=1 Tax=Acrodontium crateriforme TaxID=150365 RepID=A0AAQ3M6P7_9PEZI|nr:Hypothetical protein R9X50_00395300 [Acrodontium crateriforme]